MKYPCLILRKMCNTDIEVTIYSEGITEDGEPIEDYKGTAKCNYQDGAKTILTKEKKLVEITGTALIPGDIAPGIPTLSGGTAVVFGIKRQIAEGIRARNPDGSVNYVELKLK